MSIGPEGWAAIIAAAGVAVGSVVKPFFKWLTAKTFVAKANPEDVPKIAEAMHPQVEFRGGIRRRAAKGSAKPVTKDDAAE